MPWKGKNLTCFIRVSGTTRLVSVFKTWGAALLYNLIIKKIKKKKKNQPTKQKTHQKKPPPPLNHVPDDCCVSHRVVSQTCRAGTMTCTAPQFSIPSCSSQDEQHLSTQGTAGKPHLTSMDADICFQPSSQALLHFCMAKSTEEQCCQSHSPVLGVSPSNKHSHTDKHRTNPNWAEHALCLKCIIYNTAVKPESICLCPSHSCRVHCSPCSPMHPPRAPTPVTRFSFQYSLLNACCATVLLWSSPFQISQS